MRDAKFNLTMRDAGVTGCSIDIFVLIAKSYHETHTAVFANSRSEDIQPNAPNNSFSTFTLAPALSNMPFSQYNKETLLCTKDSIAREKTSLQI